MKGLILNDLYNIGHNAKQMLLIVGIWAVCFYQGAANGAYIPMYSVLFCMMTATTFSFDERCEWAKYAMVLPVKRQDYVFAKYIVNFIFSIIGCFVGILTTAAAVIIQGKTFEKVILESTAAGFCIAIFFGSLFIPFLIKYGAEKARIIMLGTVGIPILLAFLVKYLIEKRGIIITEDFIEKAICVLPVFVIVFVVITMVLSLRIFEKKEL